MQKNKTYRSKRFSTSVIREARDLLRTRQLAERPDAEHLRLLSRTRTVERIGESWYFDDDNEFFAEYREKNFTYASYDARNHLGEEIQVIATEYVTEVRVTAGSRSAIEELFEVFERHLATAETLTKPSADVRIFIGHGRSRAWRDLKDYLQDRMGYSVEAYEVGARAGHTIRDILEDMLAKSSFALIVLTAEDEQAEGQHRARQNVIHELGLFQGRLGFARAIAVVEQGTELLTNIEGIQRIEFPSNGIRETFGEVIATLKREFPMGSSS